MFKIRNLAVHTYASNHTVWLYAAGSDTLADVTSPCYFRDASDSVADGDFMILPLADGGATAFVWKRGDTVTLGINSFVPRPNPISDGTKP